MARSTLRAQRLAQALQAFRAFEMREELLGCLEDHAQLAQARGHPALAAQLAAAVEKSRARLALDRLPREGQRWQAWLDTLRGELSGASFDAAWQDGSRWETGEAVRAALSAPQDAAATA